MQKPKNQKTTLLMAGFSHVFQENAMAYEVRM
jgi:hypothetical protein